MVIKCGTVYHLILEDVFSINLKLNAKNKTTITITIRNVSLPVLFLTCILFIFVDIAVLLIEY